MKILWKEVRIKQEKETGTLSTRQAESIPQIVSTSKVVADRRKYSTAIITETHQLCHEQLTS